MKTRKRLLVPLATVAEFDLMITGRASALGTQLVDFWAPDCQPCVALKPILREVARKTGKEIYTVNVDAPALAELAKRFRIRGVPTVIAFRGGEPIGREIGLPEDPMAAYEKLLTR